MHAVQAPNGSGSDYLTNERATDTLRRLVRAAMNFHSSASTAVSGSSIWGGSVYGDRLDDEQFQNIENWIPPPIEEEPATLSWSSNRASDMTPDDRLSDESDGSELNVEAELTKKLEELAMDNIRAANYSKAELFLRKVADRYKIDGQPPATIASIELDIAFACCMQSRWEEADTIASRFSSDKFCLDVRACHLFHVIALKCMSGDGDEKDLTRATQLCKIALSSKRKLFGKGSESYRQTVALLARIYETQGDDLEAEAYRELASTGASPADALNELDPHEYLTRNIYLTETQSGLGARSNPGPLTPSHLHAEVPPTELSVASLSPGSVPRRNAARVADAHKEQRIQVGRGDPAEDPEAGHHSSTSTSERRWMKRS